MIDADGRLGAVRREVDGRLVDGREVHVLTIGEELAAPVAEVWVACTDPARLAAWFLPVSGDLRAGGRYAIEGNASGAIDRCDAPEGFAVTWEFDGNVTRVALALEPLDGGGTRLTLEHVHELDDPTWATYGPGATGIGWDLTLLGLTLHLDPDGDPAKAAAWTAEEAGLRFMARLGDAWGEADVAGGADPASAKAAADRTVEAYTGG
jgi:uncharacterized protein YndB with AHSA1/START domain